MANAVRHARAGLVTVRLTHADGVLELAVADNGRGMKEPPQQRTGMGLRIMQERADLIGAALSISSSPCGTTIAVTLKTA
jgi:signal transduction histidine kinase